VGNISRALHLKEQFSHTSIKVESHKDGTVH
jgi:hypothetical protein